MELRHLIASFSRLKSVEASRKQKVGFLEQLLQLVEPQLQQCQPRDLAEIMLTCSKLGCGPAEIYNICLGAVTKRLHQADARTLASVIYAVATAPDDSIKQQWGPVLQQQLLLSEIMSKLSTATPQGLSNVIWGVATMGQQLPTEQLQQLLATFLGKPHTVTSQGIANVIWGVATMGQQLPAEQLKQLLGNFIGKLSTATPQGIASVFWGMATMGQQLPAEQLQQLFAEFIGKLSTATPQGIAMAIWGVATMGQQLPAEQLQQLLAGFIGMLSTATPQNIANVIWGVATMGQQLPNKQLRQLLATFLGKLDTVTPQGIANVTWAVATMGQQLPTEQLQQLLAGFIGKLSTATPQGIANVIWGVATMGQQLPTEQLQLLLAEFLGILSTATAQNIANVIWGVATMGQQLPAEELQQLLAGFLDKLGTAVPQGIANVIWGVATMGQQLPITQLQQLVVALAAKLSNALPQDVAMTMWGVARLQPQPFFPAPLLEAEAKQAVIMMIPAMIPQEVAIIAWACGVWGYGHEPLLLLLFNKARDDLLALKGISSRTVGASCQSLTNMCWAAAVLNMQQLVRHVEQFAAAISSRWEDMIAEGKRQLYQVHMWLQDLDDNSRGLCGCLSKQQLHECKEQWQKRIGEVAASAKMSQAHQAVFEAAAEMPLLSDPPQLEALTRDRLHSIDLRVVTTAGIEVAIEVDGPQHFRQPDLQPTGTTQWRNRSLAARGYVVVLVPPWEWIRVPAAQRLGYLEAKIQQGLAGASGSVVPDTTAAASAS
jgi:hypothetical protein